MNVSTPVLYYNKAHWVKAGLDPDEPPQTLDEIYAQAKALKDAGVSEKPLSFRASRWFFETWLTGIGEDIVNNGNGRSAPATEATFATPEADDLVGLLQKMNDDGLLNAFANTEGTIDQYLALATQQSSMLIETSTASSTIAAALGGNVTAAEAGIDFDASVLDKAELVPGAGGDARHRDARQGVPHRRRLLHPQHVGAGPAGGVVDVPGVHAPARERQDLALQRRLPADRQGGGGRPRGSGVLAGRPRRRPAPHRRGSTRRRRPRPAGTLIGPYVDEALAIENALDAVLFGNQDVTESLARAQDEVTQSLERYAGD